MKKKHKLQTYLLLIIALTFVLSQLSGYVVNQHIRLGDSYELNAFFHLTHIRNHGGVFGSFQGSGWIFSIASLIILLGLLIYLFVGKNIKTYEYICFAFIIGGGLSNVADRFIYGSVIDYINIQGIPYWHYVFNTADTFIHVGIWPMIFFTLLEMRQEHNKTD